MIISTAVKLCFGFNLRRYTSKLAAETNRRDGAAVEAHAELARSHSAREAGRCSLTQ
jgi:hypothetical protein